MHRRSLPIADPCDAFRPSPGRTFCDKCQTHVHDLSAMTRSEAKRLLADNVGQRLCIAYRTAPDGTIVVRPDPRPIGLALVALGLAACTGYAPEIEHPDEHCRDSQGYEVDCNPARRDAVVIPDADPSEVSEPPPPGGELVEVPGVDFEAPESIVVDSRRSVGLVIPEVVTVPPRTELAAIRPPTIEESGGLGGVMVADDFLHHLSHVDRRAQRAARRAARRERRAAR